MLTRRERNFPTLSDPFYHMMQSLRDMQTNMNSLFGDLYQPMLIGEKSGFTPSVNVYRDGDKVTIECALPGLKREDVNVSIQDDILTISGHLHSQTEKKEENFLLREIREGGFQRTIRLPYEANTEKTQAKFQDGVLRILVEPRESLKKHEIKVNVE